MTTMFFDPASYTYQLPRSNSNRTVSDYRRSFTEEMNQLDLHYIAESLTAFLRPELVAC